MSGPFKMKGSPYPDKKSRTDRKLDRIAKRKEKVRIKIEKMSAEGKGGYTEENKKFRRVVDKYYSLEEKADKVYNKATN